MLNPKNNPQKPKSIFDQEKYRAELSSAQLVKGVCLLIMFGLACFLLGVLVGKFEPAPRDKFAEEESGRQSSTLGPGSPDVGSTVVPPKSTSPLTNSGSASNSQQSKTGQNVPSAKSPSDGKSGTEGTQTSPRTGIVHFDPPKNSSGPAVTAKAPTSEAPKHIALPPPPPPRSTLPSHETEPPEEPPVETDLRALEPPVEAVQKPNKPEANQKDATAPSDDSTEPQAAPPEHSATQEEPASQQPLHTNGGFTVQVAAYGERSNAERAKEKIEAATKYTVEFIESTSGNLVIVIAGDFPTQEEAEEARKNLEEALGFEGSFVKRR